jgi:hypothetical protein
VDVLHTSGERVLAAQVSRQFFDEVVVQADPAAPAER